MNDLTTKFFLLSLVSIFIASAAFAAKGKIVGKVTDAENGQPLAGVSVRIEGTNWGASSNIGGEYELLNIPAGIYKVIATYIGYAKAEKNRVVVQDDATAYVNFALEAYEIEYEPLVAYAPVIDPSRTTPATKLTKEEIEALPIRSVSAVVAASPSAFKGFIRGGRQYETKTFVDGIDLTDQFYAGAVEQSVTGSYQAYNGITRQAQASRSALVDVNVRALDGASVMTGTTSAEYNSATAGLVNYNLREGRGKWSGRLEVNRSQSHLDHLGPRMYLDDSIYAREKTQLLSDTSSTSRTSIEKGQLYTYVPGKYHYGNRPTTTIGASIGGDITNGFSVYGTLDYLNSYGRLPNEFKRRLNTSAKFTYEVAYDLRLNIVNLIEDRGRIFGWKNRDYADDFRYYLEGVPQWDGVNVVGSAKLSYFPSAKTYCEFQVSYVRDLTRRGFSDDNNDGVISLGEDGDFLTFSDTAQVNRYMARNANTDFNRFFSPSPRNEAGSETSLGFQGGTNWKLARPGIFYERFVSSVFTAKADFGSQILQNHLLKIGAQTRFHDFRRTLRAAYIGGVFPSFKNYIEELWNIAPEEFAAYMDDRIEFEGAIINVGFRIDALNLSAGDYANYFAPFRDDTTRVGGSVTDLRRIPVRGDDADVKWFFSPRIGVSHPISDKAAMYFSFSRQQQSQPFSRLYTNYNDFGNPQLPVISRTNQVPIRSTNYDLGIQWAFANNFGLDVNAYYRDIQNYGTISFQVTPRAPWRLYNISTNYGYADARGIEATLRTNPDRVLDWLTVSGRISYAYSYVKQSVYAGGNITTFATATDSAHFNGQLPFDDISSFNTIERSVLGGNSTLTGGYDRTHRIAFNLLARFPFEITLSSIGTFSSGFYYPLTLADDQRARQLGTSPWNKRVDVRIEKAFTFERVARVAVYVDVMNAFNWTNILAYNTSTLGLEAWEKFGDPTGGPKINRVVTQDGSMVYDIPREVYFGLNVTF